MLICMNTGKMIMTDKAELIVRLKFEIESLENGDKTLYIKMVNEKPTKKELLVQCSPMSIS